MERFFSGSSVYFCNFVRWRGGEREQTVSKVVGKNK